jgi:hypothetical protein
MKGPADSNETTMSAIGKGDVTMDNMCMIVIPAVPVSSAATTSANDVHNIDIREV